jgi:hypothetical protein
MTEHPSNPYCERLGIAVPRPEEMIAKGKPKLFHLVVAVLLERGEPMSFDALCDRIAAAGFDAGTRDLRQSVLKSWHGSELVYRDSRKNFGLNLSSNDLDLFLFMAGLRPAKVQLLPPVEVIQPADDAPLSVEELNAAFKDRSLFGLSWIRQAAAVVDACDRPMKMEEINSIMTAFTQYRHRPVMEVRRAGLDLLHIGDDGFVTLNRQSTDIPAMRRAIRKLARPVFIQRANAERAHIEWQNYKKRIRLEQEQFQARAADSRRAIVHVVPGASDIRAAVLLDVEKRSIRAYMGGELNELGEELEAYRTVAGLKVREFLDSLGLVPDRWRLVDLMPSQKTRRLNRSGKVLSITPQLAIAGTTGIGRLLMEPNQACQYLANGETSKLARGLESDIKALYAFYRYGVLHGYVRLRWGFIDEILAADFGAPGEPRIHDILDQAKESCAPVDLVTGSAPGWKDPWARARRMRVLEISLWDVLFRENGMNYTINKIDIQDIRIANPLHDCGDPWCD